MRGPGSPYRITLCFDGRATRPEPPCHPIPSRRATRPEPPCHATRAAVPPDPSRRATRPEPPCHPKAPIRKKDSYIYMIYAFRNLRTKHTNIIVEGGFKMAVQGGKTAGPPSVLRGAEWTPRAARGPPTQSRQRASSRNRAVLFLLLRKYNIYYISKSRSEY